MFSNPQHSLNQIIAPRYLYFLLWRRQTDVRFRSYILSLVKHCSLRCITNCGNWSLKLLTIWFFQTHSIQIFMWSDLLTCKVGNFWLKQKLRPCWPYPKIRFIKIDGTYLLCDLRNQSHRSQYISFICPLNLTMHFKMYSPLRVPDARVYI